MSQVGMRASSLSAPPATCFASRHVQGAPRCVRLKVFAAVQQAEPATPSGTAQQAGAKAKKQQTSAAAGSSRQRSKPKPRGRQDDVALSKQQLLQTLIPRAWPEDSSPDYAFLRGVAAEIVARQAAGHLAFETPACFGNVMLGGELQAMGVKSPAKKLLAGHGGFLTLTHGPTGPTHMVALNLPAFAALAQRQPAKSSSITSKAAATSAAAASAAAPADVAVAAPASAATPAVPSSSVEPAAASGVSPAAAAPAAAAAAGPSPPAVRVITRQAQCARVANALRRLPATQRRCALSCQAHEQGKGGYLSLVQMYVPAPADTVFLWDLRDHAPGERKAIVASLADILQDSAVLKVSHDGTKDADALQHHVGIRMTNVLDIQALDMLLQLATKVAAGKPAEPPAPRRLNTMLKQYQLPPIRNQKVLEASMQENKRFWTRRPLQGELIEYARDSVAHLLPLANLLQQRLLAVGVAAKGGAS